MARATSTRQVVDAIKDVDFPAHKDALMRAARASGAPAEVVAALRAIAPEEYDNRQEVVRSVTVDPADGLGLSPAQRAEQAREGGKPHLSQYLRDAPKPPIEQELEDDG
ncbi:Protein of unknown function [Streptomyces sp. DvalAA-14]|uniref:DUF2795 domain-containing protein n=1 Tax=unclassified Streptomyces TaxID=2593676 RepID=UPI00081AF7D0|nr:MULTISPECIES: DUF2795 domain-containing protein [unclassified Streptomyces]MYS19968.1 DUF2795 domain-containing protein [Streptomyces sp. SID4948]SCD57655.1 Protein of unknown function [Streptomyces sp. DvalAA-14]